GKIYDFPTDAYDDLSPEFRPLSKEGSFNNENRKKEVFSPVTCFNINVTKELGDYFRISFFTNNMFRHYPSELQVRKTTNGLAQYTRRNINFMFGLELSLTIK
ncbi:hypothetical protein LJC45_04580, partial [Alistipes sp. OttesenSCG-928-B03]|nr:hypothetical protein [Alistipes sp. OttesenSCG-928-B03]